MNPDVMLVIGLIVAAFSIPPILGAFAEARAPRAAAIMVLIGGGLIALAVSQKPGGYEINEIPDVFVRVVGQFIR
tara:strand:+ start:150 stop:374 length:225 start_codon:yes stop_codon:yes gene_type:complete